MVVNVVYAGNHRITTTVTSSGSDVSNWINRMYGIYNSHLNSLIVGLDTKWCPQGRYGTTGKNPIANLNLCIGRNCLIFRLIHRDYIPYKLREFLDDDRFQFFGSKGAAVNLQKNYGLEVRHMRDLWELAELKLEMPVSLNRKAGLYHLASMVVAGLHVENLSSVRLSNWSTPDSLNEAQIKCAAVDAFLAFFVGKELKYRGIWNAGAIVNN